MTDVNKKTNDVLSLTERVLPATDCNDDEEEGVEEVVIEKSKVPDGGWGWMVVFGCAFLRMLVGGIGRSSGLFYVKFLETFGGTAAQTAWVTSLSGTVRLLTGPLVSVLCNRYSTRTLCYIGGSIFVISIHISAYATSLTYLYLSYGILGGLGRSFLLTPCTLLLGQYFDKRRSLAFGLASAGFSIGGFTITPVIGLLFQNYGFSGAYILLSGITCHLFICVSLFRNVERRTKPKENNNVEQIVAQPEEDEDGADETVILMSNVSSTGSVHLIKANQTSNGTDGDTSVTISNQTLAKKRNSLVAKTYKKVKQRITMNRKSSTDENKKKLISFSVLKDIRFLTLCIATFVFSLPSSGMFLPALAMSRGISDIQAAYLLSIISGCDTAMRIIGGFVLDLKPVRHHRPLIYNCNSFIQCISLFCFPSLTTFGHFAAMCSIHGAVMGMKTAQRSVILVDILGVDKLSSSFAILLATQGIGTLIGPPVAGFLKDTYGKYDYTYYFGGSAVFLGALILAGGNIRNYCVQKKARKTKESGTN